MFVVKAVAIAAVALFVFTVVARTKEAKAAVYSCYSVTENSYVTWNYGANLGEKFGTTYDFGDCVGKSPAVWYTTWRSSTPGTIEGYPVFTQGTNSVQGHPISVTFDNSWDQEAVYMNWPPNELEIQSGVLASLSFVPTGGTLTPTEVKVKATSYDIGGTSQWLNVPTGGNEMIGTFEAADVATDPRDNPTTWIHAPEIGASYISGSTVHLKIRTDVPFSLEATPRYTVQLEKSIDEGVTWLPATIAFSDGSITGGEFQIREETTYQQYYYGVPITGGDIGQYYGYGEGLKIWGSDLSLADGLYRVRVMVELTDWGSYSAYSAWYDFGVGVSGYDGLIPGDEEDPDASICPAGVGWLCDFTEWLLVPSDTSLNNLYDVAQGLATRWPLSYVTLSAQAFGDALTTGKTDLGTPDASGIMQGQLPNLAWWAYSFTRFYGSWASPASTLGIWFGALAAIFAAGRAALNIDNENPDG